MNKISEKLPASGEDIIGYDKEGNKHWVYRCGHVPECKTWKCSITGWTLMVDIVEWEYENKKQ